MGARVRRSCVLLLSKGAASERMGEHGPQDGPFEQATDGNGEECDLPVEQVVLIVEDDPSAQELMQWFLPGAYDVDTVATATAANDIVARRSYDLILMDIDLDGSESGVDVLNGLPDEVKASTTVVAVTAYAMPGDRERLLKAGFDGYLAKPFTRHHFLDTLAKVLPSSDA